MLGEQAGKNDPKTIFGWCMYDWANSAYVTTVAVGLLPYYFARVVVGENGVAIGGTVYSATTLWGFTVGLAALVTFLFAPVLGAIADFSAAKKRFLLSFAYTGALFTLLLFFCRSGDVYRTLVFFLIAQIGFIGGNVFYDAFLPQIASEDRMDWVSGKGYAYGYAGGGLQFAVALGLVAGHERLGLSQELATRIGIGMAALWWAVFTLFTARSLREAPALETVEEPYRGWPRPLAYAAIGISRTLRTTRRVGRFRHLVLFLVAFMLYNDGIQTVINMATIYGAEELRFSPQVLMLTLLIIQAIASFGALVFGRLAGRIGSKQAVMVTLALWSGVVIYAYFIETPTEFFLLGAVVGLVLGGSQALSRSFYGSMVPEAASAEFFGFYTVFSKFSAIWGPWVFAVIRQSAGSSRLSILSLIAFFIVGMTLLYFVDERKAREAKLAGAFN
ncbi:MAG: MFS transporter [Acidobacteria bacterium]|nr:MFS transporter [Acidobacteriota bacterium]